VVAATPGLLLFLKLLCRIFLQLPHYYIIIIDMDNRFIEIDGTRLRKLRRERALSQQDIERITGISQATLSDLEQGKRGARASTLRKLAEVLDVKPKELMKEENEE
jgi:DNA-binding Xre family transcriptional regulator